MIRRGAAILAVLALAACGGGASLGGDGSGGSLGGGTGTGGSDSTDYQVGNSASGSFSKGAIAVGATMLAAGGSTGMSVDIVDKEGNLAPGTSASILFSSSRSEEHTSELQSLMRISYAVFCLNKKKTHNIKEQNKHRLITTNN